MKKQIASISLAGLLLFSCTTSAFAADAKANIKIVIDGQQGTYADDPVMQNNRVLLPFRAVAPELGIPNDNEHIIWNKGERSVTFHYNGNKIFIREGSQKAFVNDKQITLATAPKISGSGKLYVPAELIKQTLGKQVTWDASTKSVHISTSNKAKAVEVLKSFETGDPTAMEKWISPDKYIQHNLAFPSGKEAPIAAIRQLKSAGVKYDVKRVIQDGDYVAVHSEVNLFGSKAVFDIFRFSNGKIVEHWDNIQDLAAPNPSGHTMVDGSTEITDRDKTDKNKALVKKFVEDVLVGGNIEAMPGYYDGDNYIQHNPMVGDGLATVMKAFRTMAEQGFSSSYDKIHMVIGEGNFVLVVSEVNMGGNTAAVYDLFRVENGKIAEHWDIFEAVPPQDQWKNTNGKF
ncbi:nuclear transport factor 2 family protein [Paenibacillus sp. sptzw28]|uniref:stalk domain-containing protein n=1 Tax=Paenibacillus sp. sptzw28 TaxID=715179 RepID=UPI001C6E1FD9|nr:stalk domain-containing protein [Paenibacillus sp. sptzw28]QYR22479.1 nuclear transport factor 2 family protein [Paenibacillus sp. sptzw28]